MLFVLLSLVGSSLVEHSKHAIEYTLLHYLSDFKIWDFWNCFSQCFKQCIFFSIVQHNFFEFAHAIVICEILLLFVLKNLF